MAHTHDIIKRPVITERSVNQMAEKVHIRSRREGI